MTQPIERLLGRRFDHDAAHVVAAIRADHMLGHSRAALGAIGELLGLLGVMRAALAGPRVRLSPFRNGHGSLDLGPKRNRPRGRVFWRESRIVKRQRGAVKLVTTGVHPLRLVTQVVAGQHCRAIADLAREHSSVLPPVHFGKASGAISASGKLLATQSLAEIQGFCEGPALGELRGH